MTKRAKARFNGNPVSLLVLEGDTEQVFYPQIRDRYLQGIRIELRNIKGRGNVNKDVLSEIYKYTYVNENDLVRAYCCVDSEMNKRSATPLDLELMCHQARNRGMIQVLSVDEIVADPDIENWFFYDIEGIRRFLGARRSQLSAKRYANTRNLNKKDLQHLFSRFDKAYVPGRRTANFINSLDLETIVSCCRELREGIKLVQSQAGDLTDHIRARA